MESAAPARPPMATVTPPSPQVFRFSFTGSGGEFFVLMLKNIVLTVLTLGIYAAWAKTRKRQFLWRNLDIGGYRLGYTGTGGELLKGYLVVAGVYVVAALLIGLAGQVSEALVGAVKVGLGIALFLLVPFAIYRSRAYLLSRTTWRGLRFGMLEGAGGFARTFLVGLLLSVLTLGIYAPFWVNNMTRVLTANTRFGTQTFDYDGEGRELFWIYAKGFLLSVLTLGLYSFWMRAEVTRYVLSHTSFMDARGRSELTGGTMLGLTLLNLLGTTLTLGIAFPWLMAHTLRVVFSKMQFEGEVDFAAVAAEASDGSAAGDALADALDVGLGV